MTSHSMYFLFNCGAAIRGTRQIFHELFVSTRPFCLMTIHRYGKRIKILVLLLHIISREMSDRGIYWHAFQDQYVQVGIKWLQANRIKGLAELEVNIQCCPLLHFMTKLSQYTSLSVISANTIGLQMLIKRCNNNH